MGAVSVLLAQLYVYVPLKSFTNKKRLAVFEGASSHNTANFFFFLRGGGGGEGRLVVKSKLLTFQ